MLGLELQTEQVKGPIIDDQVRSVLLMSPVRDSSTCQAAVLISARKVFNKQPGIFIQS